MNLAATFLTTVALVLFCFAWMALTVGPMLVATLLFGTWGLISVPFGIALGVTLMQWFVTEGGERLLFRSEVKE